MKISTTACSSFFTLVLASSFLLGCAASTRHDQSENKSKSTKDELWLADGAISINRKVPSISKVESAPFLGFMPYKNTSELVSVDRANQKITVKHGIMEQSVFDFTSAAKLPRGSAEVQIVEDSPLWYANEAYFEERNLNVPATGAKERYLKAILGERAIYLSNGTIIYSSQYDLPQTPALKLSSTDFEQVAKQLSTGAAIEFN